MKPPALVLRASVLAAAITMASLQFGFAQNDVNWTNTGTGDWNTGSNWAPFFEVPNILFDEIANITNGGTAQLTAPATNIAAQLRVGPGTLEIQSNGALTLMPGLDVGDGSASIASDGTLSLVNGGELNVESFASSGTMNVTINSNSFRPIAVGGNANLGGTLNVDFSGFNPQIGNSWNLVDAASVQQNFNQINISGAGSLGLGQAFRLRQTSGGANGELAQLLLEQRLVLNLNRETGAGSIENPGTAAIEIDGYSITSDVGSLGSASFNGFAAQGLDNGNWFAIGQLDDTRIAELNPAAAGALTGVRELGAIYEPNFSEFGQETEDHVFTYTSATAGIVQGVVNYIGNKPSNNLVLTVDPTSGQAAMQNESPFAVSFDGYFVTSEAGSLTPSTWMSLEDQGEADWREFPSDANALGELQSAGETTLTTGEGFLLGQIFNAGAGGGELPPGADLVFGFVRVGESETFFGEVEYGPLPNLGGMGVPGDFDGDGDVDREDYLAWQGNFGTAAGASQADGDADGDGDVDGRDFLSWQANLGTTGGASGAAAVPEPATWMLLSFAVSCWCAARYRAERV